MYISILKSLRSLPNWLILISLTSCQYLQLPTFNQDTSATKEEAQENPEQGRQSSLYQVLSTDTIASIARKYKVSPQEIIDTNNIRKPYILRLGQLLKIPVTKHLDDSSNEATVSNEPSQEVRIGPKGQ